MLDQSLVFVFMMGAAALAAFGMLAATLFTVEQGTIAIVQRLGRYLPRRN